MGYVFDIHDAIMYDGWYESPENRPSADCQIRLMLDLLRPMKRASILDIGCGTGQSLLPFLKLNLEVTGLDPSPHMLAVAQRKIGHRADFYQGVAEDLPFDDNTFTYACLNTSLEFVENPCKALEEAFRVTKDRVFLGVLNKYAIKGVHRRIKGIFIQSIYNRARFFSIWELKQLIRELLGNVPLEWRTVSPFPTMHGRVADGLKRLQQSDFVQRSPFGEYTGMVVTLIPRFETQTLPLTFPSKRPRGAEAG